MTGTNHKNGDELSESEAARRRDAALKRMLETPPKPKKHKPRKESGSTKKPGK